MPKIVRADLPTPDVVIFLVDGEAIVLADHRVTETQLAGAVLAARTFRDDIPRQRESPERTLLVGGTAEALERYREHQRQAASLVPSQRTA